MWEDCTEFEVLQYKKYLKALVKPFELALLIKLSNLTKKIRKHFGLFCEIRKAAQEIFVFRNVHNISLISSEVTGAE